MRKVTVVTSKYLKSAEVKVRTPTRLMFQGQATQGAWLARQQAATCVREIIYEYVKNNYKANKVPPPG